MTNDMVKEHGPRIVEKDSSASTNLMNDGMELNMTNTEIQFQPTKMDSNINN